MSAHDITDWTTEVEPRLYLGGQNAALQKNVLAAAGVTHILCVGSELEMPFGDTFVYLRLPVEDLHSQDITKYSGLTNYFIDCGRRKGKVLVHCYKGASRSASVVLQYLMFEHGWGYERAKSYLCSRHPGTSPNAGFEKQMRSIKY
jgi:protein-tyrosine phosphatase